MNFSHQNKLMSFFCGYYLSDNSIKMLQKGPAPHFSEVMNSRQMCPVTGSYSITLSDQPCPQLWVSPLSRSAQAVSLPPSTHSRAKWSTEPQNTRGALRGCFLLTIQHHHHIRLWYNDWLCLQRFWDWKTKEQRCRPGPLWWCQLSNSLVPSSPSAGPNMFSGKRYRPLRPRTNNTSSTVTLKTHPGTLITTKSNILITEKNPLWNTTSVILLRLAWLHLTSLPYSINSRPFILEMSPKGTVKYFCADILILLI